MKSDRTMMALGLTLGMALPNAMGTNVVVTSFGENGMLTWTTGLTNASYTVQWTPSITSPVWTNSWESLVGIAPTGSMNTAPVPMFYRVVGTQPPLFDYAQYGQTDPNVLGRRTWLITNFAGLAWQATNEVLGFVRIPYASGTIYGVRDGDPAGGPDNGSYGYNDGQSLWVLGKDGWFISSTPDLASHAPCYRYGTVYDGMTVTQSYYSVRSDLSASVPVNEITLIKIEHVRVPCGTFSNAVVAWRLDATRPYVPLDFHGQGTNLGIRLPSSAETGGHAVFEFRAHGKGQGRLAQGQVTATNGVLYQLRTLLSVSHD